MIEASSEPAVPFQHQDARWAPLCSPPPSRTAVVAVLLVPCPAGWGAEAWGGSPPERGRRWSLPERSWTCNAHGMSAKATRLSRVTEPLREVYLYFGCEQSSGVSTTTSYSQVVTSATDRISCLASGWQTYSTAVVRALFCTSVQGVPFPSSTE